MSTVLVVQPDEVQADVLRRIFAKRVGAELVMVHSSREAVEEIAARMPDLILLSALLSPKDEDELIKHLRTLDGASHLQTITIPQFRTGPAQAPAKKGGLFSKKSKAPAPTGCDPMAFAEEVVVHLKDACEIRNRVQAQKSSKNVIAPFATPPVIEEGMAAPPSAFDTTPFQSNYVAPEPEQYIPEPVLSSPAWDVQQPAAFIPEPEPEPELEPEPEPAPAPFAAPFIEEVKRPARVAPRSIEIEEIDRLSRELGLNLKYVEPAAEQATPT